MKLELEPDTYRDVPFTCPYCGAVLHFCCGACDWLRCKAKDGCDAAYSILRDVWLPPPEPGDELREPGCYGAKEAHEVP